MDGDGDLDLVLGEYAPRVRLYGNVGSPTFPEFGAFTFLLSSAFGGVENIMTPNPSDWDGDGDLDLVVGSDDSGVRVYWNEGTSTSPSFGSGSWQQLVPVGSTPYNERWSPAPVDWDSDGDLDLLIGHFSGKIHVYRNDAGTLADAGTLHHALGDEIDVGAYARPAVTDWNGDGCLDLLVGSELGHVQLFLGVPDGAPLPPSLAVVGCWVDDAPPLGDGDGVLNPGEQGDVVLAVESDPDWGPVTGLTGVLGVDFAGISVVESTATFGDCAPGDTVTNAGTPFRVVADETVDPGSYGAWIVLAGEAQGGASSYEQLLPFSFDVHIWQGGWPKNVASAVKSSPLMTDLDGDGEFEVLVGCENGDVLAWRADGTALQGFPFHASSKVRSSPSASDLNSDGTMEVVFCSYDDTLWVVDVSGQVVLAHHVGETLYGSVALADVDADEAREMVFGTWGGLVWAVEADGTSLDGFPVDLGFGARMVEGPALADVTGDGTCDIVAMGADGVVHCLGPDAAELPGWPFDTGAPAVGSPSVAAFGAGTWVAVCNSAGDVFVLDGSDGSELCRYATGAAVRISPAWADINGDGTPEVMIGAQDGSIHVTDIAGSALAGWPVQLASMVRTAPAVADLDGDGVLEVVAACDEGYLYVLNGDGSPVADWLPIKLPDGVESSPAVADADGDGDLEIALGTLGGVVLIDWKDDGTADAHAWTSHRANEERTGSLTSPAGTEGGPPSAVPHALTVAPNPSLGGFSLNWQDPGTRWHLHLYDLSGRVVDRVEGRGPAYWRARVEPGVYVAHARVRRVDGTWDQLVKTRLIKLQ